MKRLFFLAGMTLGILLCMGCTSDEEPAGYDDFEHIDHWDDLARLQGEKTVIYFYDPFCDICIQMEAQVAQLLKQLEDRVEIFLIDDGVIYEQGEPPFEVFGVPSLIIFHNQAFVEWISGSGPVIKYLEEQLED